MTLTVTYKNVDGLALALDVHKPEKLVSASIPAVIYFHGGGLTVGDRMSWFPTWLHKRLSAAGIALISVDYRLLPPATGHEISADVCDALAFIATGKLNSALEAEGTTYRIDCDALAVAGTSSGGLCAYLAAAHASPAPKALLSMYGMGGNFLTSHYLAPKTEPFFRGRELLDPVTFASYLAPQSQTLPPISGSPLAYHSQDSPTPGYPANPRMQLARLYLQLGVFLDYYTGQHEPSLSQTLRKNCQSGHTETDDSDTIPVVHRCLFPQLNVNTTWPPTLICHGECDTAVPVAESVHLRDVIQEIGGSAELRVFPGKEHSFDYAVDAEDDLGEEFDAIVQWLISQLGTSHSISIREQIQANK
ncbi:Alpha/Beta hydrolase protein [Schizophyllum amplum]|uniref:Alpha/Beta hydrolase protein n=1 Tax=Schizophyllum amplum TaxID=97359 RepID=A0A550CGJ1_9AGAR|nr:Alpha/Beta hydrolase protein [Auriculariopsis ampla]